MNGLLYPDIEGGLDPKNLALLQAGLGIMAAGPGRSLGQAVGMGGMQGVQAYQQAIQQAEARKMRLAQMMEQKRLHDAQIKNYDANAEENKAQAEQRRKAAELQALQSQYMQSPDVQAAIAKGDLSVLTRMPGVGAGDLFKYAEHLGKKGKAPDSRKIRRGEKEVTQEWRNGDWHDIAEGPAFARQVAPAVSVQTGDRDPLHVVPDPTSPSGYSYRRRSEAAGGPAPAPSSAGTADRTTINTAFKYRTEYNATPEVKAANDLEVRFTPVAQYVASVTKGGQENPTRDLELAKLYLSVTHPKGDQISNMDRNELTKLTGIAPRIYEAVSAVVSGRTLDSGVRAEMARVVSDRYKGLDSARKKRRDDITKRATFGKIPLDLIFGDQE